MHLWGQWSHLCSRNFPSVTQLPLCGYSRNANWVQTRSSHIRVSKVMLHSSDVPTASCCIFSLWQAFSTAIRDIKPQCSKFVTICEVLCSGAQSNQHVRPARPSSAMQSSQDKCPHTKTFDSFLRKQTRQTMPTDSGVHRYLFKCFAVKAPNDGWRQRA